MEEYQDLLEDALVDLFHDPLAIPAFYFDTDFDDYDLSVDEEYEDDDDEDEEEEEEEDSEAENGGIYQSILEHSDEDDDSEDFEEDDYNQGAEIYDESNPTADTSDMSRTPTRRQPNFEANRRRLSINNIVSPTSDRQGASAIRIEDDDALESLATDVFSSPSQYPSFTELSTRQGEGTRNLDQHIQADSQGTAGLHRISYADPNLSPPAPPLTASIVRPPGGRTMAPPRRRGSNLSADETQRNKRRRTSAGPSSHALKVDSDEDSLFGSSPVRSPEKGKTSIAAIPPPIDLTDAPEIPEELDTGPDNRTKLRAFQCVICMDDVTNLTVTHCGHLFCAECLHQSLHTGTQQGRCPMCRQKIDTRPRNNQSSSTAKSFWPLELKLKTRKRGKGKRKAEDGA